MRISDWSSDVCSSDLEVIGIDASEALPISAKTGVGVAEVLEALVKRLPPPKGEVNAPLKAMLVDSWYDTYLGVIALVRVVAGKLTLGMKIRMMSIGAAHLDEKESGNVAWRAHGGQEEQLWGDDVKLQ